MSEKIIFNFNDKKTTQAAAFLLKLHGLNGRSAMSYLGLLKLLYISDRVSLKELGYPITGDSFVAMKYGPVLSHVYDYVKPNSGFESSEYWSKHIVTISAPHNAQKFVYVTLINDPSDDELSVFEEEIMETVYQEFGDKNPFDVAEWTHSLPEWNDPQKVNQKVLPIKVQDVLKFMGKSSEEIQRIKEIAERERYLDGVLNG